jgi:hypothetical protein
VTFHFTGSGESGVLEIVEVTGIQTVLDNAGSNPSSAHSGSVNPANTGGPIATANANDFLIGVIALQGDQSTETMGGGFTVLDLTNAGTGVGSTGAFGYRIVSSTGSYQMTCTNSNRVGWDGVLAAYKNSSVQMLTLAATASAVPGAQKNDHLTLPLAILTAIPALSFIKGTFAHITLTATVTASPQTTARFITQRPIAFPDVTYGPLRCTRYYQAPTSGKFQYYEAEFTTGNSTFKFSGNPFTTEAPIPVFVPGNDYEVIFHIPPLPGGGGGAINVGSQLYGLGANTQVNTTPLVSRQVMLKRTLSATATSTGSSALSVIHPPAFVKAVKLYGIWENPTDFPSEAYASQLDHVMVHIGTGAHGQGIKNLNNACKITMYSFPLLVMAADDGTQPWRSELSGLLNESDYLHSPDGPTGTRVQWTASPLIWVLDPRQSHGMNAAGTVIVKFLKGLYPGAAWTTGIDGQFHDGPGVTGAIHAYKVLSTDPGSDGWGVKPDLSVQQNWYGSASGGVNPAYILGLPTALKSALTANGFTHLCMNSVTDGKTFYGGEWNDDSIIIPTCDSTFAEFFASTSNLPLDLQQSIVRVGNSMAQSKDFIAVIGQTGPRNAAQWTTGLACLLLKTNGVNCYAGWTDNGFDATRLAYLQGVNQSILGPATNDGHGGSMFSPDGSGLWLQRNFFKNGGGTVVAQVNVDPNNTRGGLAPGTGSIV